MLNSDQSWVTAAGHGGPSLFAGFFWQTDGWHVLTLASMFQCQISLNVVLVQCLKSVRCGFILAEDEDMLLVR